LTEASSQQNASQMPGAPGLPTVVEKEEPTETPRVLEDSEASPEQAPQVIYLYTTVVVHVNCVLNI